MVNVTTKLDYVFCPHCASKNPKSAFVCLKCFKVMFGGPGVPIWKRPVPPTVSFVVILSSVIFSGLYLGARWLHSVEANLSFNIKTSEYNVNLTADKKKEKPMTNDAPLQHNPNKEEPVAAEHEE